MNVPQHPITIPLADDDLDDCRLTQEALQESGLTTEPWFVHLSHGPGRYWFEIVQLPTAGLARA